MGEVGLGGGLEVVGGEAAGGGAGLEDGGVGGGRGEEDVGEGGRGSGSHAGGRDGEGRSIGGRVYFYKGTVNKSLGDYKTQSNRMMMLSRLRKSSLERL